MRSRRARETLARSDNGPVWVLRPRKSHCPLFRCHCLPSSSVRRLVLQPPRPGRSSARGKQRRRCCASFTHRRCLPRSRGTSRGWACKHGRGIIILGTGGEIFCWLRISESSISQRPLFDITFFENANASRMIDSISLDEWFLGTVLSRYKAAALHWVYHQDFSRYCRLTICLIWLNAEIKRSETDIFPPRFKVTRGPEPLP